MALTELIQMQTSDDKIAEYLDRILNTVTRSKELTSKLLAFSRQGQATLHQIHVHDVIHETVSILNHTLDRRIELISQLNAEKDTVKGNASLLQNALLNMGLNAKDAMRDGGKLLFSTKNVQINTRHELIASLKSGEYLLLKVQDNGTGMSDETQNKIFDPFFTTKDIGKGTGTGLASVYGTVQEHQGVITVDSTAGKGSTFLVCLPIDEQDATTAGEPVKDKSEVISDKRTILLVDDEEDITKYRQHADKIDLLLLDMNMPKRNGL